jgi:hypothetical protein
MGCRRTLLWCIYSSLFDKRKPDWQHLANFFVGVPLGCVVHMPIRSAIRRRYGLPEDPCNGAFIHLYLQECVHAYRLYRV